MGKYHINITNHPNVTRDNQILMWIETSKHLIGTKECYQDYPLEKTVSLWHVYTKLSFICETSNCWGD